MTTGTIRGAAPQVPAGSLLLLIAYRTARELGESSGELPADAVSRWLDQLSPAETASLESFDRLIASVRAGLVNRNRSTGV